jgi:ubiquinone/menaquinone biosynthesis C-methylase UbiE
MNNKTKNRVCPVERAGGLDNFFRKLLQNPRKILAPYIREGMTVLDLGCGPGFFTIEMAKMMHGTGKVIAADLQEGMLQKIEQKIAGKEIANSIKLHKCGDNSIGITEQVDFILAFYMIHEVPDKKNLFKELKSLLKPDGKLLIVEPLVHVSKDSFIIMTESLESIGFNVLDKPKVFFGRALLLKN